MGGLGSFDHDDLSGQIRGGEQNKMSFVTDLDYITKASGSIRITTVALVRAVYVSERRCREVALKTSWRSGTRLRGF